VGIALVPKLPVKFSPSQNLPRISINFSMYGNSPRIVEMEVTSKLEAMLSRIKGIQNITSNSYKNGGNINLQFDKHTNIDVARFEVSTIIRQAWPQLPSGVGYPSISVGRSDDNSSRPFLSYTINAPASPLLIQQFAENQIKTKLSQVDGVYSISVEGATPMEWQIEYDYRKLEVLGLTVNDITSAISKYLGREFLGIGTIDTEQGEKQWIRVALGTGVQNVEKQDLENIVIRSINGQIVRLKELAQTERVEAQPNSYYRINGLNSIYMNIFAEESANQLQLAQKVKDELEKLMPSFPQEYETHIVYDATEYINTELEKIYFRSGLTLLILMIFVFITYRRIKYTLLIVISLVVNVAVAVIFYRLFGLEMQLYSLAGITISLTLIIDNTIIVSDQIIRRGNMKVFLAVLAATLTTIASLSVIFLMSDKMRLNLQDFAMVIIINLALSLLIALFLVPALLEKMKIGQREKKEKVINWRKRFHIRFNRFYEKLCRLIWRWRAAFIVFIILSFGLPVFMLPDKIDENSRWSKLYRKTIGSETYKEKIKKHADNVLGGTLRLFVQKVYLDSYFEERGETTLTVNASMPNNTTIAQLNDLVQRVEIHLSRYHDIRQFQTRVFNARNAQITIRFTAGGHKSGLPYQLYSELITLGIQLGSGDWTIYGVGDGFSNSMRESAGNLYIEMYGFNYDELYYWAGQVKDSLMKNNRIKEVATRHERSWMKDDYEEFQFDIKRERLAQENLRPYQLSSSIGDLFGQGIGAGAITTSGGTEQIRLHSQQYKEYDVWSLNAMPVKVSGVEYKISELADIARFLAPQTVAKVNQQYRLVLQYDYIGAAKQGERFQKRTKENFGKILPMGYSFKSGNTNQRWGKEETQQFLLLLLIFVIIYFNASILFNSFSIPLCILFVIPISYIGVFLTFYLFRLNFDQGGFASFILLSGLTINANIYILDAYNDILKNNPRIGRLRAYIKAWNAKVRPIFLTVISTILGFLPFIIGFKEAFWFPLAAGTIGGLVLSVFATFCFLPLFIGVGKTKNVE
jgi:multidrug efflux pump subunit AcrB